MNHCGGGPGAWHIGQTAAETPFDARFNVLAAIVAWVETGLAPDTIEGTKFVDDASLGKERAVQFSRRHCR